MSKSNAFENDLLKLIFNGTAIATLADNAATTPLTSLFVALHIADPGEAGTQATNEISYGSYARIGVARTGAGWIVSGGNVSPAAVINFPTPTSGAGPTATHFSVGAAGSGASKIFYSGALSPTIPIVVGAPVKILATSTISED